MKRLSIILVVSLFFLTAVWAQAPQQQMKAEDVQKALDLVQTVKPVPEKFKTGFDSITAKDMLAVLSYLSSDWMEGRETGTRGFAVAADYAVSLFKLWGIKPGGDMPAAGLGSFAMARRTSDRPVSPPERSYFQELTFREISDVKSSLTVEVKKGESARIKHFESGVDYLNMARSAETLTGPVVFIGYGIKEPAIGWDELKGLNIKGKVVLVLSEAPGKDDPKSPFQKKELKDKYFLPELTARMAAFAPRSARDRFNKLNEIARLGPSAILVVQNTGKDADIYNSLSFTRQPADDRAIIRKPRRRLMVPGTAPMAFETSAAAINITREMANSMLEAAGQTIDDLKQKIESTYRPASTELTGVRVTIKSTAQINLVRSMNIIGYIEGSDPKLKDEYFVVGGHLDHLGRWEDYVYNGSDDNASGSAGVIFIARAMALNPIKPKRTVVFCMWTGEELGLLGSRYYVQNPTFPINKTIGHLNYDMISRPFDAQTISRYNRQLNVPGTEDMVKKIRPPQFVTVNLTRDSGFYELQKQMNEYVGLDLFMRESEPGAGGGGSDQASFAAVKIPYVYYMTAMHPDYHQPSDSVDKASGDLLAKVTKLGYLTVFAYADK